MLPNPLRFMPVEVVPEAAPLLSPPPTELFAPTELPRAEPEPDAPTLTLDCGRKLLVGSLKPFSENPPLLPSELPLPNVNPLDQPPLTPVLPERPVLPQRLVLSDEPNRLLIPEPNEPTIGAAMLFDVKPLRSHELPKLVSPPAEPLVPASTISDPQPRLPSVEPSVEPKLEPSEPKRLPRFRPGDRVDSEFDSESLKFDNVFLKPEKSIVDALVIGTLGVA